MKLSSLWPGKADLDLEISELPRYFFDKIYGKSKGLPCYQSIEAEALFWLGKAQTIVISLPIHFFRSR